MDPTASEILAFWLGDLDPQGLAPPTKVERWWSKDPAFDQEIRVRFGREHAAVATGGRAGWREAPRGRLAEVLVLDQFSRNLFRNDARMFAWDAHALALAKRSVALGDLSGLVSY